ncbi:aquaporin AQPAe.a isoform X1 [Patella vulgata]|uniref:aquaporin AQPAe.a isoform X1 n=1 Tax=Patella vulgata TaxID=6465 RepID=UPI00217F91B9|nr:aquaporin AQPAe.a isoform X1 [Patella vulgata]XP_050396610.1 aquaporin AQPAe.a isoform X1 [Patella vulgata]
MTKEKLDVQTSQSPSTTLQRTRMVTSLDDIQSMRFWKAVIAEFLGTLLLVLVACGSCIELIDGVKSSIVQIALCFGLSVATIVWNIAHISGGHINPAVTAGMLAARKISLARAVFYLLFQLVGAIVGAGILLGLTPDGYHGSLGMTTVSPKIDVGKAVGVEFMITFILVFTVFASCDGKRKDIKGSVPLTIGLSVTMCHLFAIQYTGSSMNTARSLGPALVMGNWDKHYVYWIGPLLGGVVAGLLYENVFASNASLTKVKACLLASDYDESKYQAYKMRIRVIEEIDEEQSFEESEDAGKSSNGYDRIKHVDSGRLTIV